MKSKKIAIALTLTLILGVGGTVFAAGATTTTTTTTKSSIATHQALGMNRMAGIRGYDLAKGKGMTEEQGSTLKGSLKTNQTSCTGNFGEGNFNSNGTGNSHGNGGGIMGGGRGMMRDSK